MTHGPVSDSYRLFDPADGALFSFANAPATTSNTSPAKKDYQEFGKNYNDPEEVKAKNRKRSRRSLDELEGKEL